MPAEESKTDPWMSKSKDNISGKSDSLNIEKVDSQKTVGDFFGGAARWLLISVYAVLAGGIFTLFIYSLIEGIFEHGEGWHDLDTFEIVFIVLLFFVVKRFFIKAKSCGLNWLDSMIRIVHYSVIAALVSLSPLFLVVIDQDLVSQFSVYLDEYDLIINFGFVLTIFAMTPIPGKDDKKIEDSAVKPFVENNDSKMNVEIV